MIQGRFRRTITVALLLIAAALSPASLAVPAGASQQSAPVQAAAANATSEKALLRLLDADPDDRFGYDVALDGQTAVIGAMQDEGTAENATDAGQAYLFTRTNGSWSLRKHLGMLQPAPGDAFGKSVAIDGDRIAIGAFRDDGPNNDKPNSGSVTIFRLTTGWNFETQINSFGGLQMEPNDSFGGSVDISGTRLVVGAFGDAGISNNLTNAGAAYAYDYVSAVGVWSALEILRPAQPTTDEFFGGEVAIDGDTIVVGVFGDDGANNADTDSGAAYVFRRNQADWVAETTLRASNVGEFDWFGEAVTISGGFILVGASLEDGGRSVVENGGATYLYFRSTAPLYIPLLQR